jgi:hypothetical protein
MTLKQISALTKDREENWRERKWITNAEKTMGWQKDAVV